VSAAVAVVGAAESSRIGVVPDMSSLQLSCDAAIAAIRDSGIDPSEIDGVASLGEPPITVAHALGITPTWVDGTVVGGASPLFQLHHAAAAIAAGQCSAVLVTHGQSGRSRLAGETIAFRTAISPEGQFEVPYGTGGPPTKLTVGVARFLHQTGTTEEQLASVAVAQRRWAALNPRAMMREPITVDDVLASPLVAWPFHRLECCLVTDGGGALVIVSAERAAAFDLAQPPVYLRGAGEASEGPMISAMTDATSSKAFRLAGGRAFSEAQVGPSDVDHLMVYDAFAHIPLYGLEDLGFVGRGEAGAFVAEGNTAPGGRLPLNTNGGGLSYTHPGMYGMFAVIEAVRQLRGEAGERQQDGVEVALAHGNGAVLSSQATALLGTEATLN
jgi:acetyl-CoA acetyltransferase